MRHVYVAADDVGRHKIGVTQNPVNRCRQLSADLGGATVEFVHLEPDNRHAFEVERRAHMLLANQHDGGEWFKVSRSTALAALEMAKLAAGVPEAPSLPVSQMRLPRDAARPGPGRPKLSKTEDTRSRTIKAPESLWTQVDTRAHELGIPPAEMVRRLVERGLRED